MGVSFGILVGAGDEIECADYGCGFKVFCFLVGVVNFHLGFRGYQNLTHWDKVFMIELYVNCTVLAKCTYGEFFLSRHIS